MDHRIEVRPLGSDSLLIEAAVILNAGLGDGYVTADALRANLDQSGASSIFGAFADETMVGAATTKPVPEDIAALVDGTDAASTGLIQSSAVVPGWRRRGIGTELLARRIGHLRTEGCTAAMSVAWLSGDKDSSPSVLEAAGFDLIVEITELWYADSLEHDYMCPRCGAPCRCSGLVYFKDLR